MDYSSVLRLMRESFFQPEKHAPAHSSSNIVCVRLLVFIPHDEAEARHLDMPMVIPESCFFHSPAALAPTHSESQMSPDAAD